MSNESPPEAPRDERFGGRGGTGGSGERGSDGWTETGTAGRREGVDGGACAGVVLVTVDSLRADVVGRECSPTIQGLADRGTVFENAFAHGNWTPFSCFQVAKSVLGRSREVAFEEDDRPLVDTSNLIDAEDRALSFVDRIDGPFFLWIHYMDPHIPYVPAPRYVRAEMDSPVGSLRMLRAHLSAGLGTALSDGRLDDLRALYRSAVRQTDDSIGRVLEALRARGLRDRTCVVVAGDHGEEFGEHGNLAHYPKLYEELLHVPLIVDYPDGESRSISRAVGLDSIPPTVCEALSVPTSVRFDGTSLLDVVRDGRTPPREPVVSLTVRGDQITQQPIPRRLSEGETLVSARTAEWTYVHHEDSGRRELYHRPGDPTEQRNVWDEAGDVEAVAPLRRAVRRHLRRIGGDDEPRGEPPADVSSRLRALGYQ
ncbi:MAG: sulfatase [Salinigranum sp.]